MERFFVKAKSVNTVRKALGRAPGGARVIGRYDRDTIECAHTMNEHSLARHWPVIVSRLQKAGLSVDKVTPAEPSQDASGGGNSVEDDEE